jgi:hypothetical protein
MKSKPIKKPGQRGGKRPGSGRKKGTPNKATFELKQAAAEYGEEVLQVLVSLIRNEQTPANTIVAACRELLDRGFGKPTQSIDAKLEHEPMNMIEIAKQLDERMKKARERQQQILIERGFIDEDGNKLRD